MLDTHMWVWFNLAPNKLPPALITAFDQKDSSSGISAISVWETMTAMEKGRIEAACGPEKMVRFWLAGNPFEVIPLDDEIALLPRTLPFNHDDPADRFIAATAFKLSCPLATSDRRLHSLTWLRVLR